MKTRKLLLGVVAIVTMLFTACGKDNDGGNGSLTSAIAGTTWQLDNPSDDTYYGAHVIYTVVLGQNNDITFTRNIDGTDAVMEGTYTYTNGEGKAKVHNVGESTDFNFTFTINGNTMDFHFNLRTITLTKI